MTYQRLAEVCAQYLHTGSAVLVEGRLQMREWTTAKGAKRQTPRGARGIGALPERRPRMRAPTEGPAAAVARGRAGSESEDEPELF